MRSNSTRALPRTITAVPSPRRIEAAWANSNCNPNSETLGFAIHQLLAPTPQLDFGQRPLVRSENALHTPPPTVNFSRPPSPQTLALEDIGQHPDGCLVGAAQGDQPQAEGWLVLVLRLLGPVPDQALAELLQRLLLVGIQVGATGRAHQKRHLGLEDGGVQIVALVEGIGHQQRLAGPGRQPWQAQGEV